MPSSEIENQVLVVTFKCGKFDLDCFKKMEDELRIMRETGKYYVATEKLK